MQAGLDPHISKPWYALYQLSYSIFNRQRELFSLIFHIFNSSVFIFLLF